ncbi:hypothetical protein BGZ58_006144 [Dissophora ornata]|nr:hypothetical protein BGZ58_006144 [Dissophora ornata]
MHRRVKELLHNVSVQRIRSWFKSTIEPCALEQWRNLSLLNHMSSLANAVGERSIEANSNEDCPICFKRGAIMKVIASCGHAVCWKCEQYLNSVENISCPMCRRMRMATTYKSVLDLFKSTIGLHPSDYTHAYFLPPSSEDYTDFELASHSLCPQNTDGYDEDEVERELSDRYLWEQSASFLEYLLKSARNHAANQYFQLNAAQDLCFKSSTDQHLPEYNDQTILEPPTSGLVLPPHRLYIALIHFCLDMLTLPYSNEFQSRPEFKHEVMLIELVTLFLVPTDEFSPRGPGRVFNAPAWIEHGQHILARIHRFLQTKVRQSIRELNGDNEREGEEAQVQVQQQQHQARAARAAVPSTPISRQILYLGAARWTWVAQSLTVLVTWIQAANANPSMVAPVSKWSGLSLLGKRGAIQEEESRQPVKRRRLL